MKWVWITLAHCVVASVGLLVFVYSGFYNVAATVPHATPVYWLLSTMTERSIHTRADRVTPPNPDGEDSLRIGLEHYNAMCIMCHGAPGREPAELAAGLYPSPPNLATEPMDLSSPELYWVIKNGIKMTGMPAFGPTHSDDVIWAMASVVEKLPEWSPEEYERQLESVGLKVSELSDGHEAEEHDHGERTHEHQGDFDESATANTVPEGESEENGTVTENTGDEHSHESHTH